MHEHTTSAPSPSAPPRRTLLRRLALPLLLIAAAMTGGVASRAIGQHAFGPPFMAGPLDPATIEDRADRAVRHVAIEIDASNDQQEKLRAIVKGAVRDLLPMREKSLAARQRAQTLLTAPAIDRGAIEQFRVEQLALADAASKRFAQAIGDAADVLSPEQRRKLNERLIEFRQHRGFWHPLHRG